jgi:hypothetical protein
METFLTVAVSFSAGMSCAFWLVKEYLMDRLLLEEED